MKRTLVCTITMGGGSPRAHDTQPATTGDDSYREWYYRPANDAAIQTNHALVRDAQEAALAYRAKHPGAYMLPGEDPVRVEMSRLESAVDALRYRDAPAVEPSPCARHLEVVKRLPPIAYIRAWAAQQKIDAHVRRKFARPVARRCPHCGGRL